MADKLRKEVGANVELVDGKLGEFTVLVAGKTVARKRWLIAPSDEAVVSAVRAALSEPPTA